MNKSICSSGVSLAVARRRGVRAASSGRMLALRVHSYGDPSEAKLEEARVPILRGPSEVLVKIHSSSVNPIDLAMIGGYGSRLLNSLRTADKLRTWGVSDTCSSAGADGFPLVVGRDILGEVVETGRKSKSYGLVWGALPPHMPGSHAQLVVARDEWLRPAPKNCGLAAGGVLYAALSAAAALRAAGLRYWSRDDSRGARVLLLGLGGAGQAALQLLSRAGAQVIVGCSEQYHQLALRLGAACVLDRCAPDYTQQIHNAGPYVAAVDCAGLGGEAAGALVSNAEVLSSLTSPLLRETDSRGLLLGSAAAALELAKQNKKNKASTRWAYFSPCVATIELLRGMIERGEYVTDDQQLIEWWRGAEIYAAAAAPRASAPKGKTLIDFTAEPPSDFRPS